MFSTHNDYANNTKVIRLYSWLAYDVFLTGLLTYNWFVLQVSFLTVLDGVEKFILFLCTIAFGAYRIYILHLDAEKKKLDNQQQRDEMKEKKLKRG